MSNLPGKPSDGVQGQPFEDRPLIEVGQWYWTVDEKPKKFDWFGCVTHIGSNFVKLVSADGSSQRIHINEFESKAKREADPETVIRGRVTMYQDTVKHKLGEIREITSRLGLDPRESSKAPSSESRELSTFNAMPDMKKYKKALIKAKDQELPKLFKEVEKAHEELATWMTARTIPMKAMSEGLEDAIEQIEDRVLNVSLYAGLSEDVEQIGDGAPAPVAEKLHLFQRMHFMDEECLVNYRHGGMEFKNLKAFDAWICAPENRDRILSFPRSMVAFRVRRSQKDREWDGGLDSAFIIFRLQEADKLTFLYIRNGEKVFRMNCKMEFGEHIFPSPHQVDLSEPMMAKDDCNRFEDIITVRHWESMCAAWDEKVRLHDEWEKKHADDESKPGVRSESNPHWVSSFDDPRRDYEPFNKSSVYYDDIEEEVAKRVKYYNRIALILQGLFDRSDVLHPHPPAKLWTPGGMEALVELQYDGAGALHFGEPPDFEAYRTKCNATLGKGSFAIGQEDEWELREARLENGRWNSRGRGNPPTRVRPYGDPGPGYVGEIQEWRPKSGQATFRWTRERRSYGSYWYGRDKEKGIPCQITVPKAKLFNVSAYKLGDFKQFYQDPRTRAKYLQWAPLLIAAEEWHAGNLHTDGNLKKEQRRNV